MFYGPNAGYVQELYEAYQENPDAFDARTREFFSTWRPPAGDRASAVEGLDASLVVAAVNYANAIRRHGHLVANLSPIGAIPEETPPELDPREYQITDQDLASLPPDAVAVWNESISRTRSKPSTTCAPSTAARPPMNSSTSRTVPSATGSAKPPRAAATSTR
ncbi:MAG: hypothetical protein R2849_04385 [Thermomicrobiales bacterium]